MDQAEWMKSLCYIKLHKKDDAILLLKRIIDNEDYRADDAKDILKKL